MGNAMHRARSIGNAAVFSVVTWLLLMAGGAAPVAACPFCTPLGPSLAEEKEQADMAAWGVLAEVREAQAAVDVKQVWRGKLTDDTRWELRLEEPCRAAEGALVLVLGRHLKALTAADPDASDAISWRVTAVSEPLLAYLVRFPAIQSGAAERLRYSARYLEHADAQVAEQAYLEFGRAPLEQVAEAAQAVPAGQVRAWLDSNSVPDARKGLYGLLLGLTRDASERPANEIRLRRAWREGNDDFRAGLDGCMGGYLLLTGSRGLDELRQTILENPEAADGRVRAVLNALRFYAQYGDSAADEALSEAWSSLLARPEFAAEVIVDLARQGAWQRSEQIAGLYAAKGMPQPAVRRAVVGFLLTAPPATGEPRLAMLRQADPTGVAEAEEYYWRFGGARRREAQ